MFINIQNVHVYKCTELIFTDFHLFGSQATKKLNHYQILFHFLF